MCVTAVLPPHTGASLLSLPPALLWDGDIPLAESRVLCRPESPPMSRSPVYFAAASAAAACYHAVWSFLGGGCFCNGIPPPPMRRRSEKDRRTNAQSGKCP